MPILRGKILLRQVEILYERDELYFQCVLYYFARKVVVRQQLHEDQIVEEAFWIYYSELGITINTIWGLILINNVVHRISMIVIWYALDSCSMRVYDSFYLFYDYELTNLQACWSGVKTAVKLMSLIEVNICCWGLVYTRSCFLAINFKWTISLLTGKFGLVLMEAGFLFSVTYENFQFKLSAQFIFQPIPISDLVHARMTCNIIAWVCCSTCLFLLFEWFI